MSNTSQHLNISTDIGSFCIELNMTKAPYTCQYFTSLVEENTLTQGAIFRVLTEQNQTVEPRIHALQMGSNNALSEERTHILHEHTQISGLAHRKWRVSAARFSPGEVYQSFFICMRDEPSLDFEGTRHPDMQGFACFGDVVSGFDVVVKLYQLAGHEEIIQPVIDINRYHLTNRPN